MLWDRSQWDEQFRKVVNGSYDLRGVEVTVVGTVASGEAGLAVIVDETSLTVSLEPIAAADKIQWNREVGQPAALTVEEASAYEQLSAATDDGSHAQRITVTGPLNQVDSGYTLKVRSFAT